MMQTPLVYTSSTNYLFKAGDPVSPWQAMTFSGGHITSITTIYMLITLKCICLTQTSLWGSTFTYPGETSACSELATFLCQTFSWTPHLDEQQPHLPSQRSWKSPWTPVCRARLPSSSQGLSLCLL